MELSELSANFPKALDSPLCWSGSKYESDDSYILALDDEDKAELEQALKHFKSLGIDGDLVSKDSFPLRKLAAKLDSMRHDIYNGRGFGLVRGLDVDKFSLEDLTTIYLGVQIHIGNKFGRQDKKGNMLVHIVANDSSDVAAEHHRHSTAPITFHNEESGDVVSWFTKNTASSGGKCIIASAYTVYNVIAATRPELIRVLARADWPFALPKFHCRPIIHYQDGKLITNFGRTPLIGSAAHPRPSDLPQLSPIQVEALDAIEDIAKATQLEIATQPGDIHFINNFAILHRREGFVDSSEMNQRRHMIRTRLRDDELGWNVPESLASEWERAFGSSGSKLWHLEPMPEGFFPLRGHAN
ncbi:hypothetical protein K4F52_008402 [Lecanicillium sp. MT-2017a]|nr:hypothetical protein K4F52_008402 [Lecanicillium sp. MT-2017a]